MFKLVKNYFLLGLDFVLFYWQAQTIYSQDSPTLFNFCQNVLDAPKSAVLTKTKVYRNRCLKENKKITQHYIGQPSQLHTGSQITIARLAKTSSSGINKCNFIVKLARWSQSKTVLELGTNLGIATMALCENDFDVTSVEANCEIYKFAKRNLIAWPNCDLKFQKFLDHLQKSEKLYDLIFIDGDHSYESTKKLVEKCFKRLETNGIIIIDDIRWSRGMKLVWKEFKNDENFNLCVDLFALGILCNRSELTNKLSVKLIPKHLKPWPIYLFR